MLTREFIQSQVEYYSRILGSGNFFDRSRIVALYHYYQGLLRECDQNPDKEEK